MGRTDLNINTRRIGVVALGHSPGRRMRYSQSHYLGS